MSSEKGAKHIYAQEHKIYYYLNEGMIVAVVIAI